MQHIFSALQIRKTVSQPSETEGVLTASLAVDMG
jgi:hypothetical protein